MSKNYHINDLFEERVKNAMTWSATCCCRKALPCIFVECDIVIVQSKVKL